MRDGGGVVRVGVLVDPERALDLEVLVAQVGPRGGGRDLELVGLVLVVWQHRHHAGEADHAPFVELDQLLLVLALAGAVLATPEQQDHRLIALQL